MSGNVVDIKVLERSYRVMCPSGQESCIARSGGAAA